MKVLAIITLALCLTMAMGNREALMKFASRLTKRSIDPRQACDVSTLTNYPTDCLQALTNLGSNPTSFPNILCQARCGGPLIDFYNNCNLQTVSNALVASCATNAAGERCISTAAAQAVTTTSGQITTNCATAIAGGTCSDACRNTLNTARQSRSPGCCLINVLSLAGSSTSNPIIGSQLWQTRCNVDLPTACTSSLSGATTLMVSKAIVAIALLLLVALVF